MVTISSHKVESVNLLTTALQDLLPLLKEDASALQALSTGEEDAKLALLTQDLTKLKLHAFATLQARSMMPTLTSVRFSKFNAHLATLPKATIASAMVILSTDNAENALMDQSQTIHKILAIVFQDLPLIQLMQFAEQIVNNPKSGPTMAVPASVVMLDTTVSVDNAQEAQMLAPMAIHASAPVRLLSIFLTRTSVLSVDQDQPPMLMPPLACARVDLFPLEILVFLKFNASSTKIWLELNANANTDGLRLDRSVLRLADLARTGMEVDANVKKDMLELQVSADHAHLKLLRTKLRPHAFALILFNISTLQASLACQSHLTQFLLPMEMTGSAKKVTLSKVAAVSQTAHQMVFPMTTETAHAQAVDFTMEANALPLSHAHLDQHST